jgi:hypothetical protein
MVRHNQRGLVFSINVRYELFRSAFSDRLCGEARLDTVPKWFYPDGAGFGLVPRHEAPTAELGRIWSGRLSRGDEQWPDKSRCPFGLRKFRQHRVTVLLRKHPLETSLETTGCKHAKPPHPELRRSLLHPAGFATTPRHSAAE